MQPRRRRLGNDFWAPRFKALPILARPKSVIMLLAYSQATHRSAPLSRAPSHGLTASTSRIHRDGERFHHSTLCAAFIISSLNWRPLQHLGARVGAKGAYFGHRSGKERSLADLSLSKK